MIQVLALRSWAGLDGKLKTKEDWFEKGIRSISVEDILQDPGATLANVEDSERYNVYYTVAECEEARGRKFYKQHHIPFDVDGILVPEGIEDNPRLLEPLARVVCSAIGVEYDETGVVYSGNGLQFLVGLSTPFDDPSCFEALRDHYRAVCDKIDLKLKAHEEMGHADPSVWSTGRLLRHPDTRNRKVGKLERFSRVVQPNILRGGFDLKKASGIPDVHPHDQINPLIAESMYTADDRAAMDAESGCKFLVHCQTLPNETPEPWWYAGLSVVGRFPNGREAAHSFSRGHKNYSPAETDLKLKHAVNPKSGPRTCANINVLWGRCHECKHFGKITSPIAIAGEDHIKTINSGFYYVTLDKITGKPRKGKPAYSDLVKYFMRNHDYISLLNSPELYTWNGKSWDLKTKDNVQLFAQKNFDPEPTQSMRSEFYGHIRYTNAVEQKWFEERGSGLFNFQNGIFDIKTSELLPHRKDARFKYVLPCDYEPEAKAPLFEKFMNDVTLGRLELQLVLQEFMGYALSGERPIHHKALLLLGSGSNGKSTLIELLKALCGPGAYSSVTLKTMVKDPQSRYLMMGKLVNFAEENSRDSFAETEFLKNFISGGDITVKQLYSQPFEYRNDTKLVALMNELPRNADYSNGFYRRLLIVPFDATFKKGDTVIDKQMVNKLLLEMPGIFNFAIEGYKRLQLQGDFTESEISDSLLENYSTDSNPLKQWFQLHVDYNPNLNPQHSISINQLYTSYEQYCNLARVNKVIDKGWFGKNLKDLMLSMELKYEMHRPRAESEARHRFVSFLRIRGEGVHVVFDAATNTLEGRPMND